LCDGAAQVLLSVLQGAGFSRTDDPDAAGVVLLNTCAIREGAEQRIWGRLGRFKALKAERRSAARRAGLGCVTSTDRRGLREMPGSGLAAGKGRR
jgi:tRNA-2-methylthio-N6-dimethylallyladenosine synthase